MPNESKSVYVTLHKNFVREGISYTDRETGEQRTFNSVTMPKGTSIDGRDVSFFEFSPLYVNESRKGEDYRDIPLLKGREVWLQKTVLGEDGKPVLDADGGKVRDGKRTPASWGSCSRPRPKAELSCGSNSVSPRSSIHFARNAGRPTDRSMRASGSVYGPDGS